MLLIKNLRMYKYSFMAVVSFNGVKSHVDFRLPEDTTSLAILSSLLDNLLPHTKNIKVSKIEFLALVQPQVHGCHEVINKYRTIETNGLGTEFLSYRCISREIKK